MNGRRVHLVLCDFTERAVGSLPGFEVDTPWWDHVEPVVAEAREDFGVEILVLRLLWVRADEAAVSGGEVAYLAQLLDGSEDRLGAVPSWYAPSGDPLRAPWAEPDGLQAILGWADERLLARGTPRIDRIRQLKTWNLSSVLALPTAGGDVWCKSVPPFLADEGAVLALLGADERGLAPTVIGASSALRTVLLEDLGEDARWEAAEPELMQMMRTLVRLQSRWAERVDELVEAGVPDWRAGTFASHARDFMARPDVRGTVDASDIVTLDALVEDLPRRFAALAACGVPESLVHGDFHPGNWHAREGRLVLLDWGDCAVGHPLLDMSAFLARLADDARPRVREAWIDAWARARPGSAGGRAAELLEPVGSLRRAMVYRAFLDGIEASERVYHERDVPGWLRVTARQTELDRS